MTHALTASDMHGYDISTDVEVKHQKHSKEQEQTPRRNQFWSWSPCAVRAVIVNVPGVVAKQFIGRLSFTHKGDYSFTAVAKVKDSVFGTALLKH